MKPSPLSLHLEQRVSGIKIEVMGPVYVVSGPGLLAQLVNPAVITESLNLGAPPTEWVARVTVDIHPVIKDTAS